MTPATARIRSRLLSSAAWWGPDGPAEDPLATAATELAASRERILAAATVIIPGHGPAFRPGPDTAR